MKLHPCKNCLVVPICRQRPFFVLVRHCKKVRKYVFREYSRNYSKNHNHITEVRKVRRKIERTFIELGPACWKPAYGGTSWTFTTKYQKENNDIPMRNLPR